MDKMFELHLLTSGLRFNPEVFFTTLSFRRR